MNSGSNLSQISWKQMFVLSILCFGTFVVFKQFDSYVTTGGNLVNLSLLGFQIDSKANSENALISDTVIILSSKEKDIISAWTDIEVPSSAEYIKVNATVKTEDVDAGKNYWDGARVVFVERDESGEFNYHKPHLVGAVHGNVSGINISRVFNNENAPIHRRLLFELHNVSGTATFSNIEVYSMDISANFTRARIIVSGLWAVTIVAYFFFIAKKFTQKDLASLFLLILIALGALVPGDIKMHVNQGVFSMLCVFDFCHFVSIVDRYPDLIKYGFIYDSGIINIFKFGHVILFAAMSFFLMWAATGKVMRIKIVVFMLILAVATETLQMMFITRTPSLHDLYIDAMGITIGLALAMLAHRISYIRKYKQALDV